MPSDPKQVLASIEKTHGLQLRRFLASRLRNAANDTPDLMQEVYLRLLRIDDLDTIRNPQAYLYTVASHVLQQHFLKQASQFNSPVATDLDLEFGPGSDLDPAAQLEAEQAFEILGRTLQALSPRAYTTLVLNRCHGKTLQEIADGLGVSRGQAKKYLAKALIHVRECLHSNAKER